MQILQKPILIYASKLSSLTTAAYVSAFLLDVLLDTRELILAMVIFVFGDLVTGIWKAYKQKQKITSKALRRTIEKLLIYFLVIVLSYIIDGHILGIDAPFLAKLAAGIIIIAEFKSITENMAIITNNKVFVRIYNAAKVLFEKVKIDKE